MAHASNVTALTGNREFDELIGDYAAMRDAGERARLLLRIWDRFGTRGAVFISDLAGFSSTTRRSDVCDFLKLIHRARDTLAPIIEDKNGLFLKCDADNCYAFFESTDDAIEASIAANRAFYAANQTAGVAEQIHLSVGIDYGRLLLVGGADYFGDPVNTASKLSEDLAVRSEILVTQRAITQSSYPVPVTADRMVARISDIEVRYVRLPMTAAASA